jgi:hypothetical protein
VAILFGVVDLLLQGRTVLVFLLILETRPLSASPIRYFFISNAPDSNMLESLTGCRASPLSIAHSKHLDHFPPGLSGDGSIVSDRT